MDANDGVYTNFTWRCPNCGLAVLFENGQQVSGPCEDNHERKTEGDSN